MSGLNVGKPHLLHTHTILVTNINIKLPTNLSTFNKREDLTSSYVVLKIKILHDDSSDELKYFVKDNLLEIYYPT